MLKAICKNHSLIILSLVLGGTLNAQTAQSPKCTTIAECKARIAQDQATLKELQTGHFVDTYTDQLNGLAWSKALPGTFSNGCVDAKGRYDSSRCTFEANPDGSLILVDGLRQVKVSDSLAAQACHKVHGRLPTESEIKSLIRNFDHAETGSWLRLSAAGRADMQATFGDDMDTQFWSSSVDSDYFDNAFALDGHYGDRGSYERNFRRGVRCVSGEVKPKS